MSKWTPLDSPPNEIYLNIDQTYHFLLEKAIKNHPGTDVLKVDFDDYDDIAGDYYIGSLPTVILLDHGKGIKSTINPNLSNFFVF